MAGLYTFRQITGESVDKAFALVHLAIPDLALGDWRRHCATPLAASRDGATRVLVALDPRGYVRGLCDLRIVGAPAARRTLDVPFLVVGSTLEMPAVADDLSDVLIGLCREKGCDRLTIALALGNAWMREFLDAAFSARLAPSDRPTVEIIHRPYASDGFAA